jgi:hypothetical protein
LFAQRADLSEFLANRLCLQLGVGQAGKQGNAAVHQSEGMRKRSEFFCIRAFDRGRVFDTPVACGRLARPDRTDFAGGVIADGDDEIEVRRRFTIRRRAGELIPALAAQAFGGQALLLQILDGVGIDLTVRLAAGTVGLETALCPCS